MSPRARTVVVALLVAAGVCLPGAAAPAQDSGNPPPRKPRKEGGPVFTPGEEPPADAPEKKPDPPPEPPKSEVETLVARLQGWPAAEARAAADRLVDDHQLVDLVLRLERLEMTCAHTATPEPLEGARS